MATTRNMVAGTVHAAICIGGFVLFLAVFGITVVLLNFVLGAVVQGFQLDPKGFAGGALQYWIPCMAGMSLAFRTLKRLYPLWDRLERWKAQ